MEKKQLVTANHNCGYTMSTLSRIGGGDVRMNSAVVADDWLFQIGMAIGYAQPHIGHQIFEKKKKCNRN